MPPGFHTGNVNLTISCPNSKGLLIPGIHLTNPTVTSKLLSPDSAYDIPRLTHTHLLTHLMPLTCPRYDLDPPLSVEHIFKSPELSAIRTSLLIPHSHLDTLSDSSPSLSNIIPFLQQDGFLSRI